MLTTDTDGDGLLDGEEIEVIAKEIERNGQKYMKVYAKMISHPKMVDTDGDGYSDYVEVKWRERPDEIILVTDKNGLMHYVSSTFGSLCSLVISHKA